MCFALKLNAVGKDRGKSNWNTLFECTVCITVCASERIRTTAGENEVLSASLRLIQIREFAYRCLHYNSCWLIYTDTHARTVHTLCSCRCSDMQVKNDQTPLFVSQTALWAVLAGCFYSITDLFWCTSCSPGERLEVYFKVIFLQNALETKAADIFPPT